ncbi:Pyruvate synthase subunit PorC [Salinivirga cyanobacteriivorans]|uniref:Pyruvate synthase subunit PorC n=1 Tax=Salinivirga cyanobacteriivorans TaxID=1307839 RepID=A0A0S2HXC2_9BACT|nr:indolepyruvate oxidoreductase subunit beta [Salinivirga cyanobacteriivorans]ALO14699.1 Pyruvate synthase subunit PorC [Salinivirga cyanobacteriivorans]
MKTDIILAGVGGQGILSIAATLGAAALENDWYLKQAETHGMSQRGGAVVSHLRISDKPIYSDLIPKGSANVIISVEPMESLRYVDYLAEDGYLVTNTKPFVNIPNYPDQEKLMQHLKSLQNVVAIDADQIANDLKARRSSNIVMLGAAAPFLNMDLSVLESGLKQIFGSKGNEIVEMNMKALHAGYKFAMENK